MVESPVTSFKKNGCKKSVSEYWIKNSLFNIRRYKGANIMKKTYLLEELRKVVAEAVKLIHERKLVFYEPPWDFIREHQWSIWLLGFSSSAIQLFDLAKTEKLNLDEVSNIRHYTDSTERVTFRISSPIQGNVVSLMFHEEDSGFVCTGCGYMLSGQTQTAPTFKQICAELSANDVQNFVELEAVDYYLEGYLIIHDGELLGKSAEDLWNMTTLQKIGILEKVTSGVCPEFFTDFHEKAHFFLTLINKEDFRTVTDENS